MREGGDGGTTWRGAEVPEGGAGGTTWRVQRCRRGCWRHHLEGNGLEERCRDSVEGGDVFEL